ncbi:MAG: HEAT repeat domain-containing protein [Chloroflexota bacterium]
MQTFDQQNQDVQNQTNIAGDVNIDSQRAARDINNSTAVVVGDNNTVMVLRESASPKDLPRTSDAEILAQIEDRYCQQIVKHYNHLTLTGLPERETGLNTVPLDKVFVKLNTAVAQSGRLDNAAQRELMRLEQALSQLEAQGNVWGNVQGNVQGNAQGDNMRQRQELQARMAQLEAEARPKTVTLSVAEALQQYPHLVVIGGPGTGKTTLTRWLAVIFAQKQQATAAALGPHFAQNRLPILLELRRFAPRFEEAMKISNPPKLTTLIANFISGNAYYEDTPAWWIEDALTAGRCILLLDGVDEIANLGVRQSLSDALNAFMRTAGADTQRNLMLVTSRPHGFQHVGLGGTFQTSEVKPFRAEDVVQFITHWYDNAYRDFGDDYREEAQTLVEAIADNPRVTELATNPLLCTIIAIVYRNNRVLPNRRVELYLKCCEALLDTWERNKNIKASGLIGKYDWQTKLELLAPVAYWLHSERERVAAPEEAFVAQLSATLVVRGLATAELADQEARQFIGVIRDRSGILQGRGDGSLEFAHRTFQEYLAARHIAAQPYPGYIDMLMPHMHDQWWRETHLLVIGYLGAGAENAEKVERLLLTMLSASPLPWHVFRPFSTPRTFPKWLNTLVLVRQLISIYFPKAQLTARLAWILQQDFALVMLGYQDCTPLGRNEHIQQELSLYAEQLLRQIATDPVRYEKKSPILFHAAKLLSASNQPTTIILHLFVQALKDSEDWRVRQSAATALGELGEASPAVVDALIQALKDSEDWRVRKSATTALRKLGEESPAVLDAFIQAFKDVDSYVRYLVPTALGELGEANPAVVDALIQALNDRFGHDVRKSATTALGELGEANPAVGDNLIQAFGGNDLLLGDHVRHLVAAALGMLGEASPAALIQTLKDSEDWRVRQSAAYALGELGEASPTVVDALIQALKDSNHDVRRSASSALGELGEANPTVVDALIQALKDSNHDVRRSASSALGELGEASPAVVDALIQALKDSEDWRVRESATSALGQIKIEDDELYLRSLISLNRYLHDVDDDVRRTALEVIRTLTEGRQLPGYRWTPIRTRLQRRRWFGYGAIASVILLLVTLAVLLWTSLSAGATAAGSMQSNWWLQAGVVVCSVLVIALGICVVGWWWPLPGERRWR